MQLTAYEVWRYIIIIHSLLIRPQRSMKTTNEQTTREKEKEEKEREKETERYVTDLSCRHQ